MSFEGKFFLLVRNTTLRWSCRCENEVDNGSNIEKEKQLFFLSDISIYLRLFIKRQTSRTSNDNE